MSAYGLNPDSGTRDFVRAMDAMEAAHTLHMDALYAENVIQANKIRELESRSGAAGDRGDRDDKKKDWLELKSFQAVAKYDGSEKDFGDWEFQFQRFVRPFAGSELWLDWIKNLDGSPTTEIVEDQKTEVALVNDKIDLDWYDEQLYGVLSLLCTGSALQTEEPARGARDPRHDDLVEVDARGCGEDRDSSRAPR